MVVVYVLCVCVCVCVWGGLLLRSFTNRLFTHEIRLWSHLVYVIFMSKFVWKLIGLVRHSPQSKYFWGGKMHFCPSPPKKKGGRGIRRRKKEELEKTVFNLEKWFICVIYAGAHNQLGCFAPSISSFFENFYASCPPLKKKFCLWPWSPPKIFDMSPLPLQKSFLGCLPHPPPPHPELFPAHLDPTITIILTLILNNNPLPKA